MPFFPLLDQTETSLLSQLANSLKGHDKKGIHLLEINRLSNAPEQAEAFVNACKKNNLKFLVWISPSIQNNNFINKAEAILEKSGLSVTILYYPPLLEFLYLHEQSIKTERKFAFSFDKFKWSSLKAIEKAIKKVKAGEHLELSGEVVSLKTLTETLQKGLENAKYSDRFLWNQFQKMDQNQDGTLTVDEIYLLLSQMGFSKTEVKSLVAAADDSNDGVLTFDEFQANLQQDLQIMLEKVDTQVVSSIIEKDRYEKFLIKHHQFDPKTTSEIMRWLEETADSVVDQVEKENTALTEWMNSNAFLFLGVEVLPGKGLFTNRKTFSKGQWINSTQ